MQICSSQKKERMEARRFPMEDGGEYLMTWEVEETIEARLPGRWQYRPYLVVSWYLRCISRYGELVFDHFYCGGKEAEHCNLLVTQLYTSW